MKTNYSEKESKNPSKDFEIYHKGEYLVTAEKSDTILSKLKGLMFRKLGEKEGMLFIFEKDKRWKFWMPFVPEDLGMVFLDSRGRIIDKMRASRMTLNPKSWKIYKPKKPCRYVLEINPKNLKRLKLSEKLRW